MPRVGFILSLSPAKTRSMIAARRTHFAARRPGLGVNRIMFAGKCKDPRTMAVSKSQFGRHASCNRCMEQKMSPSFRINEDAGDYDAELLWKIWIWEVLLREEETWMSISYQV